MAVTATPIFPQTINNTFVQILPADTTTKKTVYTGGTNGSKVEKILLTNTDTNAYTLNWYITSGGTDYLIGTVSCPLSSGNTTSAPTFDLFANSNFFTGARDACGNPYIYLNNGAVLKVASTGTVTAAKAISVYAQGGDY